MLKFKQENCIGCNLCQLACSAAKELEFNPRLARLAIDSVYTDGGQKLEITGRICDLCGDCVEVCPAEAIVIKNGQLKFDEEECTNCGECIEACEKMIIWEKEKGIAICDYCEGSPWCVKWCPHEALIWEVEEN